MNDKPLVTRRPVRWAFARRVVVIRLVNRPSVYVTFKRGLEMSSMMTENGSTDTVEVGFLGLTISGNL
jgi:hypothetical protein